MRASLQAAGRTIVVRITGITGLMQREQARQNLISAIRLVMDAFKTVDYYNRVLSRDVRELYNGEMEREAFVDDMVRLIDEQLRRAWNEGMRDNDLDPQKDMTPEWEARLQEMQLSELDHVEDFADAVIAASQNQAPLDPLYSRVELWTNRYNEVVNEAHIATRPEDRYKWIFGDTDHCNTCAGLNGIVASGKEWAESGYQPQGDMLECHGFRCQCRLEYTEEPLTEGGIPTGL